MKKALIKAAYRDFMEKIKVNWIKNNLKLYFSNQVNIFNPTHKELLSYAKELLKSNELEEYALWVTLDNLEHLACLNNEKSGLTTQT